jgi:hypothetical protein
MWPPGGTVKCTARLPTATQSSPFEHDTDAKDARPLGNEDGRHVAPPSLVVRATAVRLLVVPTAVQADGEGQATELKTWTEIVRRLCSQVVPRSLVVQAPPVPVLVVPTARQVRRPGQAIESIDQPWGGDRRIQWRPPSELVATVGPAKGYEYAPLEGPWEPPTATQSLLLMHAIEVTLASKPSEPAAMVHVWP